MNRVLYYARFFLTQIVYKLLPWIKKDIVESFHQYYYDSHLGGKGWREARFLGVPIQKCPLDLFVYQEILNEIKPDLIIETGTAYGGGALFLASMCDLLGKGEVITVDITPRSDFPQHKRVTYITGSSVDSEVLGQLESASNGKKVVMVILDSDHSRDHVFKELKLYSKFVTKGSYLIVEDSNVNGHPVYPEHGPGPMEAIVDFLKESKEFVVDKKREKHYVSFNPSGYLLKTA